MCVGGVGGEARRCACGGGGGGREGEGGSRGQSGNNTEVFSSNVCQFPPSVTERVRAVNSRSFDSLGPLFLARCSVLDAISLAEALRDCSQLRDSVISRAVLTSL